MTVTTDADDDDTESADLRVLAVVASEWDQRPNGGREFLPQRRGRGQGRPTPRHGL